MADGQLFNNLSLSDRGDTNPARFLTDQIDYVQFERHAAAGSNMQYFDLLIRLKTGQEHLFRNIQKDKYDDLFYFISQKGLKIMKLGDAQARDGVTAVLQEDDDDAVDPHLERIRNEAGADESGEEKPGKKEAKKETSASKKKPREATEDGSKKKKPKKNKDPNAPKRPMPGFMFFSYMERENTKKSNPGISFMELGRVLGEKWNKMSAEAKEPYEEKSRAQKIRYKEEISAYKNSQNEYRFRE